MKNLMGFFGFSTLDYDGRQKKEGTFYQDCLPLLGCENPRCH